MAMEYEASITQETKEPNLFVLTINGSNENTKKPLWSKVLNFKRTDSVEEIRKYQTVEDLRNDISRERTWRVRERLAAFVIIGGGVGGSAISFATGTSLALAGILGSSQAVLGLLLWDHADEGLSKFKSALKAFEETSFRVAEPIANDQIPAQA